MAPTLCSRCGDAVDEGCDPRDELAELDALLERIKLKRLNAKRKINRLHSSIIRRLPPDVMSTIFEFCLPYFTYHHDQFLDFFKTTSFSRYLSESFAVIGEILLGQCLASGLR